MQLNATSLSLIFQRLGIVSLPYHLMAGVFTLYSLILNKSTYIRYSPCTIHSLPNSNHCYLYALISTSAFDMAVSVIGGSDGPTSEDATEWLVTLDYAKFQYHANYSSKWLMASNASICIANSLHWFKQYYPLAHGANFTDASGLKILGGGTVKLTLEDDDGTPTTVALDNVAYSPHAPDNRLSISCLLKAMDKSSITCTSDEMEILKDGKTIGYALCHNGVYELACDYTAL